MVLEAIAAYKRGEKAPQREIHLALVVPDIRLFNLLKTKAMIVQPPFDKVKVHLHIIVEDKKDPLNDIDWQVRIGLVQSGLMLPEDINIAHPDQVTLGWNTEDQK